MLHDVSAAPESNLSVDGLAWSPVSGDFVASVRSYADEAVERTVTLRLNGAAAGQQSLVVPPGESVQVPFESLELAAGGNRVTAELTPGDDLGVDDTRYLVVNARSRARCCWSGRRARRRFALLRVRSARWRRRIMRRAVTARVSPTAPWKDYVFIVGPTPGYWRTRRRLLALLESGAPC